MAESTPPNDAPVLAETKPDLIRDRAVRLFRYLAELTKLRRRVVRDIRQYVGVFWFHHLPRQAECYTSAWEDSENEEDVWLRIDKPQKPQFPTPPEECTAWLPPTPLEDSERAPTLCETIEVPREQPAATDLLDDNLGDELETKRLADHPGVIAAWQQYLDRDWAIWRVEEQRYEKIQTIYRKLFAIYQEQQRRGEEYELLLGVGVLTWMTPAEQYVRHPVVMGKASLRLDAETGKLVVGPDEEGACYKLEQDMLDNDERPPNEIQERVAADLEAFESILNRNQIIPLLRAWTNGLPAMGDAQFEDTLRPFEGEATSPKMAFAPVLILRKRSGQTIQTVLEAISQNFLEDKLVPRTILSRIGDTQAPVDQDQAQSHGDRGLNDEILFPLPANDEQIQIIRALKARTGLLVQGPPGTGKSHTIVNLLCHLLAHGKRVLVTSQTPRALRVLRKKIEDEIPAILPLAVSVLGSDRESRRNLEGSVRKILAVSSNPVERRQEIAQAEKERAAVLREIEELNQLESAARKADSQVHTIHGTAYRGTAFAIAKRIEDEAERYVWLTDRLDEGSSSPMSPEQFGELCDLLDQYGDDFGELAACDLPDAQSLPTADAFGAALEALELAQRDFEACSCSNPESRHRFAALSTTELTALANTARYYAVSHKQLIGRPNSWIRQAVADVLSGRDGEWRSLDRLTGTIVEQAKTAYLGEAEILRPAEVSPRQLLADARDLTRHLERGRSLGWWFFRSRVASRCRYMWTECRFNGAVCDNPATLRRLIDHLALVEAVENGCRQWARWVAPPDGTLQQRIWRLEEWGTLVAGVLDLIRLVRSVQTKLNQVGISLSPTDTTWPNWVESHASGALALHRRQASLGHREQLVEKVAEACQLPKPHPIVPRLVDAASKCDAGAYRDGLRELASVHSCRTEAQRCNYLYEALRSHAPRLAAEILVAESRTGLRAKAASIDDAWSWKLARQWLRSYIERLQSSDGLDQRRLALEKGRLPFATAKLVAARAWNECVESFQRSPGMRGVLEAWHLAMNERRYDEAREYLHQCQPAIPAWIMPINRVVEQITVESDAFDVVIIDEASQTGPEGLFLQYLGRKCIVVGDDKQISPEAVGIPNTAVRALMGRYLYDIPFYRRLGPRSSLFAQAAIAFGERIVLREHFRCIPEIIRFSNDLCYANTPLKPLRQYPADRLKPIQARRVIDGYREGRSPNVINRPEAAALAKCLIDCLRSPLYQDKSFGVICLQGHQQARLIEKLILDHLGPEPFQSERQRLVCGDPYSFQGDERDVIFLSLVAATGGEGRVGPMTRYAFEQRFNVAASRARDQMWLFHSIAEADLHKECMRRRLLHFCCNLRPVMSNSDLGRCDSQFERDVAIGLMEHGFRVIPQFPVAGKRIDLVVEDRERRLAIECDGDAWHGPDQYEADMARQRMLERCGWKFLRIRGSAFYANQNRVIDELIDAIRAHGLEVHSVTDDESIPGDGIEEISGNECMEVLETHRSEAASGDVGRQLELFTDERASPTAEKPSSHNHALKVLDREGSPQDESALLARPISSLHLSHRACKCMFRLRIHTVGELIERTSDDLLQCRNFGQTSLNEVRDRLAAWGLQLRGDSQDDGQRSVPAVSRLDPDGARRLWDTLTAEDTGNGSPPTAETGGGATAAESSLPRFALPRTTVRATTVSAEERNAVLKALDEAGRPLITHQIVAICPGIDQPRMEEILPFLVHERAVERVMDADATRYTRGRCLPPQHPEGKDEEEG